MTIVYGRALRAAVVSSTSVAGADRWEEDAACRGNLRNAEVFYRKDVASVRAAKAVCARCPVRERCLQWALETKQDEGVLGGLSEGERRARHGRWPRADIGPKGGLKTRVEQLMADPQEYRELVEQGLKPSQIAKELSTNVATLREVGRLLDERDATLAVLGGVSAK